ncbi:MAG TPA: methyltransferase domain-containing protein [Oscillatoriaceae cyanobacterium]
MDLHALWVPPRSGAIEWIDRPDTPPAELEAAMRDIRRINAVLGTYAFLLAAFARLASWPAERPLRVLDAATGTADVPQALVRFARARQLRIEVVGLDLNARVLEQAASAVAGMEEITLVRGDALAMPYADGHFDWAFNHLALHHFPPEIQAPFLRELDRVVRPGGGVMIGDLLRSRLNFGLAWGFLHVVSGPYGRRDGLISVLNALSRHELDGLVATAGLAYLRHRLAPPTQFVLAGLKPARQTGPNTAP